MCQRSESRVSLKREGWRFMVSIRPGNFANLIYWFPRYPTNYTTDKSVWNSFINLINGSLISSGSWLPFLCVIFNYGRSFVSILLCIPLRNRVVRRITVSSTIGLTSISPGTILGTFSNCYIFVIHRFPVIKVTILQ